MNGRRHRVSSWHSLRTQLIVGSVTLLVITLGSISYSLVVHEKRMLTNELEKTILLQGRNIALGCEKILLREDPEFELFPRVKRILEGTPNITSLVITDASGIIVGHRDIQQLAQKLDYNAEGFDQATPVTISLAEQLYGNWNTYFLKTSVKGRGKAIGYVYVQYSKQELHDSISDAIRMALIYGSLSFALGILLSLLLFSRISHSMTMLVRGVNLLGKGNLNTRIQLKTKNEFGILADSFNDMSERIARAQLELVAKERMDHELKLAHDIQQTLMPAEVHQPEGYAVGMYYQSALEVGGDYLDVIPVDSRNVVLVMADVSGKGVPGLVVTAMLKIMVQELAGKGSPREVIENMNVLLSRNIRHGMFVTMFLAYLDTETGLLRFSNAGHNPLLIYDDSECNCRIFKMQGPPLGVIPAAAYGALLRDYQIQLDPGDLVLQYTDGLNESMNIRGDLFQLDRVVRVCQSAAGLGAKKLVRELVAEELQFRGDAPQADDIALLSLEAKARKPALAGHQGTD